MEVGEQDEEGVGRREKDTSRQAEHLRRVLDTDYHHHENTKIKARPISCIKSIRSSLIHRPIHRQSTSAIRPRDMSTRRRTKKTIASYYEESDSDFVEEVKRPNKRRKVKKDVEEASFHADGDNELGAGVAAPHPASLHILGDPKPLRTALLNWYAVVHEKRGMPWRKRFDASLDAKGQSQRAYEVRVIF